MYKIIEYLRNMSTDTETGDKSTFYMSKDWNIFIPKDSAFSLHLTSVTKTKCVPKILANPALFQ